MSKKGFRDKKRKKTTDEPEEKKHPEQCDCLRCFKDNTKAYHLHIMDQLENYNKVIGDPKTGLVARLGKAEILIKDLEVENKSLTSEIGMLRATIKRHADLLKIHDNLILEIEKKLKRLQERNEVTERIVTIIQNKKAGWFK